MKSFKNLFLTSTHQNDLKIYKKNNLKYKNSKYFKNNANHPVNKEK